MRADTILAYTYRAAIYCPKCIVDQLPTGNNEQFDGWALTPGAYMTTEDNLNELAAAFGLDRTDERSFDSDDFPKVVFACELRGDETCDCCAEQIA